MDAIQDGWFSEKGEVQGFDVEVEEVLHHEKSKFQDILVFSSKMNGRVLVLNGIIWSTEGDEFAYLENIAHLPLFSHPNPQKVLVVGGGDGGVLREIGKHPMVEEMHICEIDERVIEVRKKYFPNSTFGFSNPKVHVHIQDGLEFMKKNVETFDVIITDASHSTGSQASSLLHHSYFEAMKRALKPGGLICVQAHCVWTELNVAGPHEATHVPLEAVTQLITMCKTLFPVVSYAIASTPSLPGGQSGFLLASSNQETVFEEPLRKLSESEVEEMDLKCYNSDVHRAAFALPQFAKKALKLKNSPF